MKFTSGWQPTGCKFGHHPGEMWLPVGCLPIIFITQLTASLMQILQK
jgi:hypothetical protein